MTPCYMIVLATFSDYERFMRGYQSIVGPLVAQFGGEYILIGSDLLPLEGTFPGGGGSVVSRWPSREAALAFWNSSEYASAKRLREGTGTFQVVLVDAPG